MRLSGRAVLRSVGNRHDGRAAVQVQCADIEVREVHDDHVARRATSRLGHWSR